MKILQAMRGGLSAPALNASLDKGDLSQLTDDQLTFVLGHRNSEYLREFGSLDAQNLEILRDLSTEELKGYFEATAGKPALKIEVRKLSNNPLKLFCSEFANPDQDTKDTLTYLNAHPSYLEYWALLPNALPVERKNKKLYLAVDSVKTSQVSKHIEGEVPGHGRAVGGHFAGDLKYHADGAHQGYVKNTSDKLRFKPAWVTSPANYHTTAPFPYNPRPTDPMTINAPAVRNTNEIEMNNNGAWVAKTNIHGLKIGSSIFPNNWTLKQVEAETALACFKINANPGTAHVNANTYRVMDSAGTTRLQLFIGDSTDPHPFVSKPNVDLDIKSCFPIDIVRLALFAKDKEGEEVPE